MINDVITPIDKFIATNEFKKYKDYFHSVDRYRGAFFVEMKRQVALKILKKYSHEVAAGVVNLKRVSVTRSLTRNVDAEISKVVQENLNEWIENGVYPLSCREVSAPIIKDGELIYPMKFNYELVNNLQLNSYICKHTMYKRK